MEADFWLQRWRDGRIGWHRDAVMPLLEKHWPEMAVPQNTCVLVPLCGKSLDMIWLAAQGLRVLGVELSPLAVAQFFAENHLQAQTRAATDGPHWYAGNIEIINGDIFGVPAGAFASCAAIYDRAALIALPAPMRERYAHEVYGKLPSGCRGLMITLEYPPDEMAGPPFPVDGAEVHRLFGADWDIEQLERRDILNSQPSFSEQGVTALFTAVYRLSRRSA